MKHSLITLAILCAVAGTASANGFVLNDHGAAATGRADAVAATTDDGSSIVHNVAGIAGMDGTRLFIGGTLIMPSQAFTDADTNVETQSDTPIAVTPQLYATHQLLNMVTVGLGFHTPFGSTVKWGADSPAAEEIRSQTLRTFFITPSAAVDLDKLISGLRVGAGIDFVPATVRLKQDIFFGETSGTADLGGTAFGIGFRAGVQYTPSFHKKLSVGVSYRSQVNLGFEGTGDFDIAAPYRTQLPPDGDISVDVSLPQSVLAGVAYRPLNDLELELNIVWMDWSKFDQLDIVMPDDSILVSERRYQDKVSIRVGAEYNLPRLGLALRAGYMYDPTPIPASHLTFALPDVNRHDLTAGASYQINDKYGLHLGILAVLPGSKDTGDEPYEPLYKGTYDVSAFLTSVSLDVKLR